MRTNVCLVPAVAVVAGSAALVALWTGAPTVAAQSQANPPLQFSQARLIIEFNDTDQDIGAQVFLDGEAYRSLKITDPRGKTLLDIKGSRSLRLQGLTELFFESSEPSLAEVPLEEFLARFPEGNYKFEGVTIEGKKIRGTAPFTHIIPQAPVLLSPAEGSVQNPSTTVVRWTPVPNPPGSAIVSYQAIVVDVDSPLPKLTFSVHVPANVSSVNVPASFMRPGRQYEFEVLAIESGGNQTLSSGEFRTAP